MTRTEKTIAWSIGSVAVVVWLILSAVMLSLREPPAVTTVKPPVKTAEQPADDEPVDVDAAQRKFERDFVRDLDEMAGRQWAPDVLDDMEELAATDGKLFSPKFQMALAMAIAEQHQMRRDAARRKLAESR